MTTMVTDGSSRTFGWPGDTAKLRVYAPGVWVRMMDVEPNKNEMSEFSRDARAALCRPVGDETTTEVGRPVMLDAALVPEAGQMLTHSARVTPHVMLDVEVPADKEVVAMVDDGNMPLFFKSRWEGSQCKIMIPAGAVKAKGTARPRHTLRLFAFNPLQPIAELTERTLVRADGLKMFAKPPPKVENKADRILLLVHGALSSTEHAFGELRDRMGFDDITLSYKEIVGWNHVTVTKGALENAGELLQELPKTNQLDIVCHSRGALVVRAMLEHPKFERARAEKLPPIGKVIFVAGANQGTELARRVNYDVLLNTFLVLALAGGATLSVGLIAALLKVTVADLARLPGLADLAPDSQLVRELNEASRFLATKYIAVRANTDRASSLGARLGEAGADLIFRSVANDLVVPFDGAAQFDAQLTDRMLSVTSFAANLSAQSVVHHNNFFSQQWVADRLREELVDTAQG